MAFNFRNWIFSLFPDSIRRDDSYKNNENKGLLERYTQVIDHEVDEEIYPHIRDIFNLLNAKVVDIKYLPYLAYSLGDAPLTSSTTVNRKLIAWLNTLWAIKGKDEAYAWLGNLFGIRLKPIWTYGARPVRYDNYPLDIYDDSLKYDTTCPKCSTLTLAYHNQTDDYDTPTHNAVTQADLDLLEELVLFIIPIDVTFNGFIKEYRVQDSFPLTILD